MRTLLLVALGGAVGSSIRYAAGVAVARVSSPGFPWGTFAVNVAGSFAIGALLTWAEGRGALSPEARLLLVTGLLGGFTTFSAYAWETLSLVRNGQAAAAFAYAGGSVLIGLAAAWAGHALTRS